MGLGEAFLYFLTFFLELVVNSNVAQNVRKGRYSILRLNIKKIPRLFDAQWGDLYLAKIQYLGTRILMFF